MTLQKRFYLLSIARTRNDSERLVKWFRQAGRPVQVEHIDNTEQLLHQLNRQAEWDLILIEEQLRAEETLSLVTLSRKHRPEMPIVILTHEPLIDEAAKPFFDAGACAVLNQADQLRLVRVVTRELDTLQLQRDYEQLRELLTQTEARLAEVTDSADLAIGYIADGVHIHANPTYCELLGYQDYDEIDCMPIIDLIAPDDQELLKNVLRTCSAGQSSSGEIALNIIGGHQEPALLYATLTNDEYEGEACVRVEVSKSPRQTTRAVSSQLEQLLEALGQVPADDNNWLLYISLDGLNSLRQKHGLLGMPILLRAIADFCSPVLPEHTQLFRVTDDAIAALLQGISETALLKLAQQLCTQLREQIFEVGSFSAHVTVSIGMVALQGQQPSSSLDWGFLAAETVRENSAGRGNGVHRYQPALAKVAQADAGAFEQALKENLEAGVLSLSFQPLVSLGGSEGEYYEVSLCDSNPDEPQLEAIWEQLRAHHLGNTELDRWMLMESTKQLALKRIDAEQTRQVINLSTHALRDESLPQWLGVALKAAGLPAESIVLQFDEQDVSDNLRQASTQLSALQQLGCRIGIRNFGCQEDPLRLLSHTKPDLIILEPTTTDRLAKDRQGVTALIDPLKERQIPIAITGVASAGTLAMLWQLGVDFIQGEYLQPPRPVMDYEFTDIA